MSLDDVARRLQSELGAGTVRTDPNFLARHEIDGKRASVLCSPASIEELLAALRICSESRAAVTPLGGGTAMRIGNPPNKAEVIMSLSRLDRVVEHDAENLTVSAQAGITIGALNLYISGERQFVPLDVPQRNVATVGGTVAANLNGPRRSAYGSIRDLVIGIRVALITGENVKAGGKVVKNVAGYDMCKLFVGSLGTLAIISEITLRLTPVPESVATVIAAGRLSDLLNVAEKIAQSQLNPTAIFLIAKRETATRELRSELA